MRGGRVPSLNPKRTVSSLSSYFFLAGAGIVLTGVVGAAGEAPTVVPGAPIAAGFFAVAGVGTFGGAGVGVGVTFGLKGFFSAPRTRRRPLRSLSAAGATIGSVASTDALSLLTVPAGGTAVAVGSEASSRGTATAAAIRTIATGHSLRWMMKRRCP